MIDTPTPKVDVRSPTRRPQGITKDRQDDAGPKRSQKQAGQDPRNPQDGEKDAE